MLPNMLGFDPEGGQNQREFSLDKAKAALEEQGWKIMSEERRSKLEGEEAEKAKWARYNKNAAKFLKLTLTVPNYPELLTVADILKKQWQQAGIDLEIEILDTSETIQNRIQERDYEILLFGEMLQSDPDPTPFWHSSSKEAPGLNLALFSDKEVDSLLDSARQEVNEEKRADLYRQFQAAIDKETPVIFLFSPYYLYALSEDYQGIDIKVIYNPSDRFNDILERHLKQTRVRK
jgi:peptide/nickel transport system substrate-binding protein